MRESSEARESAASPRRPVGAAIVTHQQAELAARCAESVAAELGPDAVVLVVNLPTTAAALPELPGVRVVVNAETRGYGANLNAGIAALPREFPYMLLLNDDVTFEPGAIARLSDELERHPEAGLVGPAFVDARGHRTPSAFRFSTPLLDLAQLLIVPQVLGGRIRARLDQSNVGGEVGWTLGAAMMVRTRAFREVGGFDERFFLYTEETDLARRMRDRGWTIRHVPRAVAVHVGGQSTTRERRYHRMVGSSRFRFARKHWTIGRLALLLAGLPFVYAWNALYVALRILFSPRSARAKLQLFSDHWSSRPLP